MELRYRGYLPHLEGKNSTYFITFRLAGTMPSSLLELWKSERIELEQSAKQQGRTLTDHERAEIGRLYSDRIEEYLDKGIGDCYLKDERIARMVTSALQHFDGFR